MSFLLDKLDTLGHHYADIVEKYSLQNAIDQKDLLTQVNDAIEDLLGVLHGC